MPHAFSQCVAGPFPAGSSEAQAYPFGQQYEQSHGTASGVAQQPQPPVEIAAHVEPAGHVDRPCPQDHRSETLGRLLKPER